MRAFIILGFVLAAVNAAKLGYNYGPGVSGIRQTVPDSSFIGTGYSGGGSGLIGGGGIIGGGNYNGGGSSRKVISGGGLIGGGALVGGGSSILGGGAQLGSYGYGNQVSGGHTTVVGLDALDSVPQTVEYNKQVYFFQAPEEHHEEGQFKQQLSNVLKKNLQVVFIKAPENNAATNAALQLAKQAIEQRTAIYVLSKENDASQVVGQLQQIQENVQTAPEVRIVKYRTPEDLAYAREYIQSQYDNFGGPSDLINGGTVPVLNYASPAASTGSVNVIGSGNVGGSGGFISGVGTPVHSGHSGHSHGSGNVVSSLGSGTNYVSSGSVLGGSGASVGGVKYVSGSGSSSGSGVLSGLTSEYLPPAKLKK